MEKYEQAKLERFSMNCSKCGAELREGAAFCPKCGSQQGGSDEAKGTFVNETVVAVQHEPARVNTVHPSVESADRPAVAQPVTSSPSPAQPPVPDGQPIGAPASVSVSAAPIGSKPLGMIWTVVMRVLLCIAALVALSNAFGCFSGGIWQMNGVDPDALYALIPSVEVSCMISGVLYVLSAALLVLTVVFISMKKRLAPLLATWIFLVYFAINLITSYMVFSPLERFTGVSMIVLLVWGALLSAAVGFGFAAINRKYFGKRKDLFVN